MKEATSVQEKPDKEKVEGGVISRMFCGKWMPGNICPLLPMGTQLLRFEAQWEMCGAGRKLRALLHLRGILKVKATWQGQGCKGEGFILCKPCVVNRPQGIGQTA